VIAHATQLAGDDELGVPLMRRGGLRATAACRLPGPRRAGCQKPQFGGAGTDRCEPVSMGLVKRVVNDLLTHPEQCQFGACQAVAMAIWWAMLTAAWAGLSEHAATSMAML